MMVVVHVEWSVGLGVSRADGWMVVVVFRQGWVEWSGVLLFWEEVGRGGMVF